MEWKLSVCGPYSQALSVPSVTIFKGHEGGESGLHELDAYLQFLRRRWLSDVQEETGTGPARRIKLTIFQSNYPHGALRITYQPRL